MRESDRPEVVLALAILERVVADLQSTVPEVREVACKDVAAGGLDYWIEMVAVDLHVADALRARIAGLVPAAVGRMGH